jgi:type IV pilus assembly protein PilV
MIELLVALMLVSTTLLGQAALQVSSLKMTKGAGHRTQAIVLAAEIAERMENNRAAARAGQYQVATGSTPAVVAADCGAMACTTAELAAFDVAIWQAQAAANLPGATWQLTQDGADPSRYTVVLTWQERRDKSPGTTFATAGEMETLALSTSKVVSP